MRIAVIGAGNMGSWLVESLCLDYEVGVYDVDRSKLKYFFNSTIERTGGESMASASVKDKIRILIENENHESPFSDDKIASILQGANIQIARRTVAKYRKVLNILPSNKRKQL